MAFAPTSSTTSTTAAPTSSTTCKEKARKLVSSVLTNKKTDYGQKKVITRVNSIDSESHVYNSLQVTFRKNLFHKI